MNSLPTFDVPYSWILLLLVLILLPLFLITRLVYKGAAPGAAKPSAIGALLLLGGYFGYILAGTKLGWFSANTFPAQIILWGTLPFACFLFLVVWPSKWWQAALQRVDLTDLITVHSFRVIGGFFLILTLLGTLPKWFGFIAGAGDLITALTSFYVVKQIVQRKEWAPRLAMVWNTFGLLDIIFTAISANVLTKLALDQGGTGVAVLAQFPFAIIPAFAPPIVIFLHFSIYKKLRR